jgi:hypothetical protein
MGLKVFISPHLAICWSKGSPKRIKSLTDKKGTTRSLDLSQAHDRNQAQGRQKRAASRTTNPGAWVADVTWPWHESPAPPATWVKSQKSCKFKGLQRQKEALREQRLIHTAIPLMAWTNHQCGIGKTLQEGIRHLDSKQAYPLGKGRRVARILVDSELISELVAS